MAPVVRSGERGGPSRDARRTGKSPTIVDVAAAAGVSKSTVSNVVRGVDDVADATRERVLQVMRRLNYKPNAIARQFAQQRTTMLGVLVGDLENPYYAQMARVVERQAFRRGYTAMFCNIEGEAEIAVAGVEALLEHRIAGVVFLAFIARTPQLEESLRRADVPIVFLGLSENWGDSVGPQDAEGAKLAVDHLLKLGHRRIGYVRTPLVEPSGDGGRYAGYRSAMRQAGAPALAAIQWEPGAAKVRLARRTLPLVELLRGDERPTALFVSNDIGAIAMMEACDAAGVRVPQELSIVGFDDIAIAGLRRISLTTVAQPLEFQAETAVHLLLDRIAQPRLRPRHVSVPVELRVRTSTAPPKALAPARRRVGGARP
jgi:LacI family transcriptional regulator